jgi:hypothetical protein
LGRAAMFGKKTRFENVVYRPGKAPAVGIVLGAPRNFTPPPDVIVEGPEDRGNLELSGQTLTFRGERGTVKVTNIQGVRTFDDAKTRTWVVVAYAGSTDSPFQNPAALFADEAGSLQDELEAAILKAIAR